LIFNDHECKILVFRDITAQKKLLKAQSDNKLLALLQAGFSHEFITPIKSISTFAKELKLLVQDTDLKYKAELIFQTSQMLHS
jgi:hypothetical protein